MPLDEQYYSNKEANHVGQMLKFGQGVPCLCADAVLILESATTELEIRLPVTDVFEDSCGRQIRDLDHCGGMADSTDSDWVPNTAKLNSGERSEQ